MNKNRRRKSWLLCVAAALSVSAFIFDLFKAVSAVKRSQNSIKVYWNSSNPIFRIDNTDHILDVNVGGQIDFICPSLTDSKNSISRDISSDVSLRDDSYRLFGDSRPLISRHQREGFVERSVIYLVNEADYVNCEVNANFARKVAVCDSRNMKNSEVFTVTFRTFSPLPGAIEFQPGHDYFFISTSEDGNLHSLKGGRCSSHNMRLMVKLHDGKKSLLPEPRPQYAQPRRPKETSSSNHRSLTSARSVSRSDLILDEPMSSASASSSIRTSASLLLTAAIFLVLLNLL